MVGEGHVELFGERPRHFFEEAERHPVLAVVPVAGSTLFAASVPDVERDGDVIALADRGYFLADFDDASGRLVAEDLSRLGLEFEPLPIAHPPVPVAPTDPAGFEFNHRTVRFGIGCRYVFDGERFAVVFQDSCSHGKLVSVIIRHKMNRSFTR